MKLILMLFAGCLLLGTLSKANSQDLSRYPVIPWPQHLEAREGTFALDSLTQVTLSDSTSEDLRDVAAFWAEMVRSSSGLPLPLTEAADTSGNTVAFVLDSDAATGGEGYRLEVTPTGATLTAAAPAGLFYGVQTLRQLMPVAVERGGVVRGDDATVWAIPAVLVEDAPRFGYRGLPLDVGRHFFPVSFVKKYLDLMAFYKLNRFHWHLTEDQGWRIEIKQYPKLTEVGAYRGETLVGHYDNQPQTFDSTRYGGFYTQEEIREVVAYAAARHITVIPEIELPGHSLAALSAYPELGCTPGPFEAATTWGVFEDIYCPKEETFQFLENVLTEVMDLFPSEYIHIGGDEAPKTRWEESELAQEVIRREGLEDEHGLQSYFIQRIERFLNEHGRRLIGWDEIVEGGLSPTATLMFWRNWNEEALQQAAEQGNDLIMTPNQTLYFDHYQADPAGEPLAIGGLTTLADVYAYEPVPSSYSGEEAEHVLGAQANVWTEYLKTPQKVEYMVFPRLLALSEVVWSGKEARNWFSFKGRLPSHLDRLNVMTVNYRPLDR
ncbi:MAG: beta-N-acetylhexosaminidase [Rhodothermales bacterium]